VAVGALLEGSQSLRILVTSRVRLNIALEREYTLQPLGVPADEKRLTVNELARFPAVQLFVRRARTARSDFVLTQENAEAVAEICRRLDGLPLAIELAAVRVKLFAPRAILKRLESALDLLTGGAKDLPERQQTMRGAIGWSYDLLDEDEKKLFHRLCVFRGGFTLEGAAAVGNAAGDPGVDLLDVVSSLVDKSLISQREQTDGEPRFRMLIVVREFAAEKLEQSGEQDEIKRRHAEFYTALAVAAEPDLLGRKRPGG
jgi:predicted ATPase